MGQRNQGPICFLLEGLNIFRTNMMDFSLKKMDHNCSLLCSTRTFLNDDKRIKMETRTKKTADKTLT
jgi:hypothetical protein